ncbi:MAG: hypothetical protein JXR30_03625 [Alphaproteobacteria bacterium]|nr:hypothetical protein [Alphaproteobacteria bacterium]
MQKFSTNAKIIMEACEKISQSLKRDFGEIEHLQQSVNGPTKFAESTHKRFADSLVYEIQKVRPKYSMILNNKKIYQGADIAHTVNIQTLSGKKSFLHGLSGFTILVGLQEQNDMMTGVIYDPLTDEISVTEKGKGASLYHPYRSQQFRVSKRENTTAMLLGTNDFEWIHDKVATHLNDNVGKFIVGVASGKYDAFIATNLTDLEKVLGKLFVQEAGGKIVEENDRIIFSSSTYTG